MFVNVCVCMFTRVHVNVCGCARGNVCLCSCVGSMCACAYACLRVRARACVSMHVTLASIVESMSLQILSIDYMFSLITLPCVIPNKQTTRLYFWTAGSLQTTHAMMMVTRSAVLAMIGHSPEATILGP